MIRRLGVAVTLALSLLVGMASPRTLAASKQWWGLRAPSSLTVSGSCHNSGSQYVWIAEAGSAFLDIIQVGVMGQTFFYAYGSGTPNAPGSNYTEIHLGNAGIGSHSYSIAFVRPTWTIKIDGRVVATVNDAFRTWTLRSSQTMAEGTTFGKSGCTVNGSGWQMSGYGTTEPPTFDFGNNWWSI
jgi:hypothetical protein